ncbi:MAG: PAS domain S-box protein [Myxococcales bacterium]|nr:PAS domain S-box protein [Myxococcales bacterium]
MTLRAELLRLLQHLPEERLAAAARVLAALEAEPAPSSRGRSAAELERTVAALQASEARLRTIADYTLDWENWTGPNGELRWVSPSVERLTGYTAAECQAMAGFPLPLVVDADRPTVAAHWARAEQAPPIGAEVEFRVRRKDGAERWVAATFQSLRDAAGAYLGQRSSVRDVTGRKRVEEELRGDLRVTAALSSLYPSLIAPTPSLAGVATAILEQARALTGSRHGLVSLVDANGGHVAQVLTDPTAGGAAAAPALVPLVCDHDGEYPGLWGVALRTRAAFYTNEAATHAEARDTPFGQDPLAAFLAVPVLLGPELVGQIALANPGRDYGGRDLAAVQRLAELYALAIQRARVDERLQASERLYHSLVANLPQGVVRKDLELRYVFANARFCESVGKSAAELLGKTATEVLPAELALRDEAADRQVLASGAAHAAVEERRRPGGALAIAEVTRTPLFDAQGELVGVQTLYSDVTERRLLEDELRQAQKMESIGRLAGGVAHDFNNLLSPILVYAELLMQGLAPDDRRYEDLGQIREAAERARALTRQLLALGRKQVLELAPVDLGQLVSATHRLLGRTFVEDVRIALELPPGPTLVMADAGQIEQVLLNLAINAQDAMPSGGVLGLALGERCFDEAQAAALGLVPGTYAELAVADTGSGMDAATLAKLFEPFFTTKERGKGTGLGLATAYGIAKQHGGTIVAESELGRGSVFRIYLPRAASEGARTTVAPLGAPVGAARRATIAVVDDDDMTRRMAARGLLLAGYEVLDLPSAESCLALVDAGGPRVDLLLTDVVMPGMDGRQLYQELVRRRRGIKALFMSGHTEEVVARRGVPAPGQHFLSKPFSARALTLRVRQILEG